MTPISEACPYDDTTRASRCESCCTANGALTPCVLAYLRGQIPASLSNIVPLHRVFLRDARRAA